MLLAARNAEGGRLEILIVVFSYLTNQLGV